MPPRKPRDIDGILRQWPFEPGDLAVRLIKAAGGRDVIQMRIDMGLLQLEVENRPDGSLPGGAMTYFDYLLALAIREGDQFVLSAEQCMEVDREFLQFYHRRICWLQLREFGRAIRDADHSLALMDFVRKCSPNEDWTGAHEQYRPYILFHRTQAASHEQLKADNPEAAIEEVTRGLERIRAVFVEQGLEDAFAEDEMVKRLEQLRENLRDDFQVGRTLQERLADAIASEQYELAAELRDELRRRH